MSVLPSSLPEDGEDLFTAVACPDCSGTLVIRAHRRLITFVCRIGHVYSPDELLAAKEEILERRLWIAFSALHELAVLLEDFVGQELERGDSATHHRRSAVAWEQAAKLRSIIEADRPLTPREADRRSGRDSP